MYISVYVRSYPQSRWLYGVHLRHFRGPDGSLPRVRLRRSFNIVTPGRATIIIIIDSRVFYRFPRDFTRAKVPLSDDANGPRANYIPIEITVDDRSTSLSVSQPFSVRHRGTLIRLFTTAKPTFGRPRCYSPEANSPNPLPPHFSPIHLTVRLLLSIRSAPSSVPCTVYTLSPNHLPGFIVRHRSVGPVVSSTNLRRE